MLLVFFVGWEGFVGVQDQVVVGCQDGFQGLLGVLCDLLGVFEVFVQGFFGFGFLEVFGVGYYVVFVQEVGCEDWFGFLVLVVQDGCVL